MKKSKYLQTIGDDNNALLFHSLKGNLFLLNKEYLQTLNSFSKARELSEEEEKSLIISELIAAAYLVNEQFDERKSIVEKNQQWMNDFETEEKIRLLDLMVSESCNFGCKHCLHSRSTMLTDSHGKKRFMDFETAKKAIDIYYQIINKLPKKISGNIHFGSAEPLLNWKVVKEACLYAKKLDNNCLLSINTNLTLLTKEQAIFFKDHNVYVSTSLDGPKNGNDKIRTYKNLKGTFNDILKNIFLLQNVGHPIDGFSVTINDLNFDSINEDFVNWATEKKFKAIGTDIDLINEDNCTKPIQTYVDKLIDIRIACEKCGIENFGSWTTVYENLINPPEDGMPTFCKAIKGRNVAINPEGKVFLCGHTTTAINNSFTTDIFKKNSTFYNVVKNRLPGNDPFCLACPIEGVCSGQCHITREVTTNLQSNKTKTLCDFYKTVTQQLLERKLKKELLEII
ncbi:MAG: radical SAM protein [Candidatus Absconditabacterales bacterium]|jgi:radical SAM protein with 4Fe4S-binding SPASM domain